jgi:hypothetical protein
MKRYFDMYENKAVVEFNIKNGSNAATAPVESFETVYHVKMREINREECQKLKKEYTK